MESIVEQVLNAENIRIMVLLVFGCCCYVLLKTSFEKRLDGLDKKIDGVEASLNKRIDDKINGLEASLLRAMDEK